jgi:hypothetical protein
MIVDSKGQTPAMGFVFLSYSNADKNDARKLVEAMRARDVDIWWDDDRRFQRDDWGRDVDERLEAADVILALVTRSVVESPRDYVLAEMVPARDQWKLIALQIGDIRLPYKIRSLVLSLNRWAYRDFEQLLQAESLEEVCAACRAQPARSMPSAKVGVTPFEGELTPERLALAVATAALEELQVDLVFGAARDLEKRLRAQLAPEDGANADLLRSRTDKLRAVGATTFETTHPRLNVPVTCVRFTDPQRRSALVEYAWDELDGMRDSLLAWLDGLAASHDPDTRASIGMMIGVLARSRFATVLEKLLTRWMMSEDPAMRDVADLAFRVALDGPGIEHAVATKMRDWVIENRLPPVRAAVELACGYTGSRLPDEAIKTLKAVNQTKVADLKVVALMHDAIDYLANANRSAADGSLFDLSQLLKRLCEWVNDALPLRHGKLLPLILYFKLMSRLPIRRPKGVPGVLSLEAVMADPEMAEPVTRIFDVVLRQGAAAIDARDLARECLKRLSRRAQKLLDLGLLADDPVLQLMRGIYAAAPTDRDRDRLAHAVAATYSRGVIASGLPASRLPAGNDL